MPQPLAVTAFMASPGRFELPAPRLGGVCSIQLSYGDIFDFSWSRMERSAFQDFDDLIIRRRTLYPAELRAHTTPGISANEYARHVVPVVGLEPTRCCHQRILSPHRLPFRHTGIGYSCYIITYFSPVRKSFFPGTVHSLMLLHTGAQRPVFKGGALCIFQVLSS